MPHPPISAVIFDFDGTILDADGMRCVAVLRLTRRLELPAVDLVLRSFANSTLSQILSRLDP